MPKILQNTLSKLAYFRTKIQQIKSNKNLNKINGT